MDNREINTPPGHLAKKPTEIPARGWWQTAKRVKTQIEADQVQIVAAGIAFYLFLALFPVLAAIVATYGIVTDPAEAETQISSLEGIVPPEAFTVIAEMVRTIASEAEDTLGWSVALSILLSIWSANKGTKALVTGLNIAYDEKEERGFFRLTFITLSLTLAVFVFMALMITLVAGIPAVIDSIGLPAWLASTISIVRWPLLAVLVMGVLAVLYRMAPDRDPAKWRWVSPGAIVSTMLWLGGSVLFSIYIEKFGSMSKTYGPFAAVVTLMLWLFLTAFIVLLGAEINSESELQTAKDTTKGSPDPLGRRGAYHADHVAAGEDGQESSGREDIT